MAESGARLVRKVNLSYVHRLSAGVSLLAFFVITIAGILAEVRVTTITYRAVGVVFLIGVVTRVLVRVLASYEEMNSGKT